MPRSHDLFFIQARMYARRNDDVLVASIAALTVGFDGVGIVAELVGDDGIADNANKRFHFFRPF